MWVFVRCVVFPAAHVNEYFVNISTWRDPKGITTVDLVALESNLVDDVGKAMFGRMYL
jgi:hypothetical protein